MLEHRGEGDRGDVAFVILQCRFRIERQEMRARTQLTWRSTGLMRSAPDDLGRPGPTLCQHAADEVFFCDIIRPSRDRHGGHAVQLVAAMSPSRSA